MDQLYQAWFNVVQKLVLVLDTDDILKLNSFKALR